MTTKRMRTYMVLGMTLLLSGSLFISSGGAAEKAVISFVTRNDSGNSLQLINTRGEFLQRLMVEGPIAHFTWSPHGRSVAYSSNRNGGLDIYVMDMRTNTHRQLTFDAGKDWWPAWSPNGKWIAFASNRAGEMDLYRMDATGENVKRLTNQGACKRPAWSPDSRWIAFVSKSSLFFMSTEGRGVRQLADTFSNGCTWSPDGKEIAFAAGNIDVEGVNIIVIDVNKRNRRNLTRVGPNAWASYPAWSPDGEWIAYFFQALPVLDLDLGHEIRAIGLWSGDSVIYVTNSEGENDGQPLEATRGVVSSSPVWVPEGFFPVSPQPQLLSTQWGHLKK